MLDFQNCKEYSGKAVCPCSSHWNSWASDSTLLLRQSMRGSGDGVGDCVPAIHVRDLDGIPNCWLQPDPVPAVKAWRMNQETGALPACYIKKINYLR